MFSPAFLLKKYLSPLFISSIPIIFILMLLVLNSCSSQEKLSIRKQKFHDWLNAAQTLEAAQSQDVQLLTNENEKDILTLFQNKELEELSIRLEKVLDAQQNQLNQNDTLDDQSLLSLADDLDQLKKEESIDFFSTLDVLYFYYDYFEEIDPKKSK